MNPLAKLDQLNLEPAAKTEVAAMLQALMDQVVQDAKVIQAKEVKIGALTHELAYYKRIRFSRKNESLAPLQRDVFEETWIPTSRRLTRKSGNYATINSATPWPVPSGNAPEDSLYRIICRALNIATNRSLALVATVAKTWSKSAKTSASNWTSSRPSFSCIAISGCNTPAGLMWLHFAGHTLLQCLKKKCESYEPRKT
jgi:hypothetical protein